MSSRLRRALQVGLTSAAMVGAAVAGAPVASAATAYYVDCSFTGSPSGTQAAPLTSLSQVNGRKFGAGDSVLFKRGTTCTGRFVASGSGAPGSPITVGAYGTGARPVLDGAGAGGETVLLKDVSHWTVRDLRVTNPGTTAERAGVRVRSTTIAAKADIVLTGLEVDHVAGWSDKTGTNADWFKGSAGISVLSDATAGAIAGLHITGNYVHDTGGGGIKITIKPAQYHTDVLVARNQIVSVGGDGIVVHGSDAPLVEYNRADDLGGGAYPFLTGNFAGMWPINSRNPVFQFNEVTRNHPSTYDSTAWDCDGAIVGTCTYQYNFSSNNAGGFFLGCQHCTEYPNYHAKQVIRYNVSQDDCRIAADGDKSSPSVYYNNTFYCMARPFDVKVPIGATATTLFANNIFVSQGGSLPAGSGVTYRSNLYWGGFPAPAGDEGAVKSDPKLNYAGGSATGFNSVAGYQLTTGSPALGTGTAAADAGTRDYFGAPVPRADGKVDIGADNSSGVAAKTYSSLREAFDNVGISNDLNPKAGGITLSGRSFSGQALEAAGIKYPRAVVGGVGFDWPQRYYGFPDNVKAAGQKITVSGSGGKLSFLGAATFGTQSGTGTVTYTDGTFSSFTLSFGDFWAATPIAGNTPAAAMTYHHKPPTKYNDASTGRDEQDVRLWSTSVPLDAAKSVASVTLPDVGGPLASAGLHVFSMAIS
ncbi:right-handed parallel beta-helix repeat-containing protein [Amycolatopsis sp. CA-128772]|uniref:right-handed parallel beta-helix repeat-containing protein n=1 Tax=Amycolatopsis sp. CA-128772 TaxID=2073159 RepID=UPI0011AFDF90|nr:right-handed parallel beta-helix repeat-containing protein [Amycolatopsis sp. CA-128772]